MSNPNPTDKLLVCHRSGECFTAGRIYKVIAESSYDYTIKDDFQEEHSLTKKPDEDGLSYMTWFIVCNNAGNLITAETEDKWQLLKQHVNTLFEELPDWDYHTLREVMTKIEQLEGTQEQRIMDIADEEEE